MPRGITNVVRPPGKRYRYLCKARVSPATPPGATGKRVPRVTHGPHGASASVHISEVKEKDHDMPEQKLYDAPVCQMLLM